jgi:hypothetical protein
MVRHIILEPAIISLGQVALAIVRDDHTTTWLEGLEEILAEGFLVCIKKDGATVVDNVIVVLRVLHAGGVLNTEGYLFLDFLALLGKILPDNFDYAGREINAVDSDALAM